jgi:hypothetical protein
MKKLRYEDSSPFGRLMFDWMWAQRPPASPIDVARHLGMPKQTIYNWLSMGDVPTISNMAIISQRLNIPMDALVQAAHDTELARSDTRRPRQHQYPRTKTISPVPAQRETKPLPLPPIDPWQFLMDSIVHDDRLDEATKIVMLKRIREVQTGYDPMARHIAAEHAEPEQEETSEQPAPDKPRRTARR